MSILIFILVIFVATLVHEAGHFVFARIFGVGVYEFSIGFGPRIFKSKYKETDLSVRVLPLGGFVRIAGLDEGEVPPGTKRFDQIKSFQRILVILAGPVMNIIMAAVLFTLVYTQGVYVPDLKIQSVNDNFPAAKAGIQVGDKIVAVNDIPIKTPNELIKIVSESKGEKLKLTILRDGKDINISLIPEFDQKENRYLIGIMFDRTLKKYSILESIYMGFTQTISWSIALVVSIWMLITGKVPVGSLAGPIGIANMLGQAANEGPTALIFFIGFLSLNLGILNLLPIPALDGSRILFLLVEVLRGKPIDPKKENFIHVAGFVFLILLMIFVSYFDILRIFKR
ncbi:membrane-associated zinc metalloprotease [Thermodesulfobium narugense DSM 14796]|uniref:Zinc metalloprotease n=1 Tax=Thermodesulfobium narugense DSM 14796 TaxID=747365 RepID=M1E786_9BACT|nr:RIP metalloprotease RseP [Thermodesulfobium narugense]AEE14350.1 membrane-associated zinc metalloprotease [Thermodesulfobium narugense DSM 14796]